VAKRSRLTLAALENFFIVKSIEFSEDLFPSIAVITLVLGPSEGPFAVVIKTVMPAQLDVRSRQKPKRMLDLMGTRRYHKRSPLSEGSYGTLFGVRCFLFLLFQEERDRYCYRGRMIDKS
jgi:hypothetical protein